MELGKAKAIVSKIAKEKCIDVQSTWDMFFFDEILLRLSKSKYCKSFIIKGGFYLQNIVGVETRGTMDIDFKYIGSKYTNDDLKIIFSEICSNHENDNIYFRVMSVDDIITETKYGGKTIRIEASFYNVRKRFGIDIAIGDVVTPNPIKYDHKLLFKNEECKLFAYNIETIIAEKFETLISKGMQNSRSKDLFDLYLLNKEKYDVNILNDAMVNTFYSRKTKYDKIEILNTLNDVFSFDRPKELYENYAKKNKFVKDVSFEMCKLSILNIFTHLKFENKIYLSDYNIELHLVRHGESDKNIVGGWSDSHLTENGKQEVVTLLTQLEKYDVFVSSDLPRAMETSNIINTKLNMDIIFNDNFREANNGIFKNKTINEFLEHKNFRYSCLKMNENYPSGESPTDFNLRVKDAFFKMLENNKNKKIILVTHGGVITVILCLLNGYQYSNKLQIMPHTGSILKLK